MDPEDRDQFTKLRAATSNLLPQANSRSVSPHLAQPNYCDAQSSTRQAKVLLGCYRAGEAADPEIYVTAVAAVLSSYPPFVAERVADPRSGLSSRSKWLPTVSEVRESCEQEMAPIREDARREAQRAKTAALVGDGPEVSAERRKQLAAEIMSRFADLGRDPDRVKLADPRKMPNGPLRDEAMNKLAEHQRQCLDKWKAEPVRLSPAALATLGIKRTEDAA